MEAVYIIVMLTLSLKDGLPQGDGLNFMPRFTGNTSYYSTRAKCEKEMVAQNTTNTTKVEPIFATYGEKEDLLVVREYVFDKLRTQYSCLKIKI